MLKVSRHEDETGEVSCMYVNIRESDKKSDDK
jgi:hypothetical protein